MFTRTALLPEWNWKRRKFEIFLLRWYWTWASSSLLLEEEAQSRPRRLRKRPKEKKMWEFHFQISDSIVHENLSFVQKFDIENVFFFSAMTSPLSHTTQRQLNFKCRKFCIIFGNCPSTSERASFSWHSDERNIWQHSDIRPLDGRWFCIAKLHISYWEERGRAELELISTVATVVGHIQNEKRKKNRKSNSNNKFKLIIHCEFSSSRIHSNNFHKTPEYVCWSGYTIFGWMQTAQ